MRGDAVFWVVFSKRNNLLSRVIRWVTGGTYSHVLLLFGVIESKRKSVCDG